LGNIVSNKLEFFYELLHFVNLCRKGKP